MERIFYFQYEYTVHVQRINKEQITCKIEKANKLSKQIWIGGNVHGCNNTSNILGLSDHE